MPKASTSTGTARPALRRNQACRACRKRKLKCDAARPHCGTCVKQWQAMISVPAPVGYAHPSEPQCSYDPVEGLTLSPEVDPLTKIKVLEEEISQLKVRLFEKQESQSSPGQLVKKESFSVPFRPSDAGPFEIIGNLVPQPQVVLDSEEFLSSEIAVSRFRSESNSPEFSSAYVRASDPFLALMYPGWNQELPDPPILEHYVDVFFRCDPSAPRILHRPSFLSSMLLHPKHPDFPHPAILHAICACASRWTSQNVTIMPDGRRRDRFADFHVSKTRQYIDHTIATGADIFAVTQACILLSWYFYHEGRWVEIWIFAGFQTRVSIPLRLNYPGTVATHATNAPAAYLPPPKDLRDLDCRRRSWWMTILFDRIVAVGGWIHAVDERDLGTELPLRLDDFELDRAVPGIPQDISQADFFTHHPPEFTDSFILLIKAVMMFGRVTDFHVRRNLRSTASTKTQNPFFISGFKQLDSLVCTEFLHNLPPMYKHSCGLSEAPDGSIDSDLYLVHLIPHAAAITLHNPFIDFANTQSISTARCVNAARSILSAYFMLSATSLDICRLHPFVTIIWYLAAVVQVQLCKYFIETGDTEREANVWGEINILRFAMLAYGERSFIGTRQESLLQGLMREIVRMTSQKEPLEMGVPLYPFSHASLWAGKAQTADGVEEDPAAGIPLPSSPPLEEAALTPGTLRDGMLHREGRV